jgi:MoxR-like ATPase
LSTQSTTPGEAIRLAAEERNRDELEALRLADRHPRPPGWLLSPRMVEVFVLGSREEYRTADGGRIRISPKYLGDRALIQVAIATLASDRALLLVGDPGTAKSWLSEHLTAAICGTSRYVVQGTAGTTEDQVKYSWNYALLLAEGPSERALVPSPVYRAMAEGRIVRFEELTRCAAEIQDTMISLLSEKEIAVPELNSMVAARRGFNLIATANTRDRGVNEMSSALRRRFNFVVLPVVSDPETEMAIVRKRSEDLMADYRIQAEVPEDLVRVLVTLFRELRQGRTLDGQAKVKSPSAPLSTAEAISVLFNGAILAASFGDGRVNAEDLTRSLLGSVVREDAKDAACLLEYMETVARGRGGAWHKLYEARRIIPV